MIIHKISRVSNETHAKISCVIELESKVEIHTIWLTIDKEYAEYLTIDRVDAFVILLLPLAMLLNEDIKCDLPMTEDIMYGLVRNFIPTISEHSEGFHSINIYADVIRPVKSAGNVGTGCSGGVDSLYTIMTSLKSKYHSFDITHLCVFNNFTCRDKSKDLFNRLVKNATYIADDLSLPLIICNSNCMELLPVPKDYNYLNTYVILFYVFSLQKFFGKYYLASDGKGYKEFSVENGDKISCASYDLLTLSCLTTDSLKLILSGGDISRIQKTKEIADWKIAQKYLKVCNENDINCCVCGKCKRTIMQLEALGKIERFNKVFDPQIVQANRYDNLYWLYKMHCIGDNYVESSYQILKNKPLMSIIKNNDKVWGSFVYAKGIYDDGWIQSHFEAKSKKNTGEKRMRVTLYISDLTPTNTISIMIQNKNVLQKSFVVGSHQLEIDVPLDKELSWSINCSNSVVPKDVNISDDIRELACVLQEICFFD